MEDVIKLVKQANEFLLKGDNIRASAIFIKVGNILLCLANKETDKKKQANTWLSAGTAYLNGGAIALARDAFSVVDTSLLDPCKRDVFEQRRQKAQERDDRHYRVKAYRLASECINAKEWNKLLDLLADDPYFTDCATIARWRKDACIGLGQYALAKEFDKDRINLENYYR